MKRIKQIDTRKNNKEVSPYKNELEAEEEEMPKKPVSKYYYIIGLFNEPIYDINIQIYIFDNPTWEDKKIHVRIGPIHKENFNKANLIIKQIEEICVV